MDARTATAEQLRQSIEMQHDRLRREIPADREAALLTLIRVQDRLPRPASNDPIPDLLTGHRIANLGGNKAIALLLQSPDSASTSSSEPAGIALERWAERFLTACGELAEAEIVRSHAETGFMKLVAESDGTFSAWIATRQPPPSWRERADINWWASWLATTHEPELEALRRRAQVDPEDSDVLLKIARVSLKTMAYQIGLPPDVTIGDLRVGTWLDVLAGLIGWELQARDTSGPTTPIAGTMLVTELATMLGMDPEEVRWAIDAFTLNRQTAGWHAAVPGVAAAPLVRLENDRLVPSLYGLTTEPLLFLMRELRRRDPDGYHNAAQHREAEFRNDLYAIFDDKRFVTSEGTIRLRQGKGDLRTDIDAVVFDRKTGALGVFELKSQDPFARSAAALARQRDSVLYANRQVAGVLDWTRRFGPNDLLGRVDGATAKRFRVHKIYPFVLGRYLAHFNDGAQPDSRAAWGTWPQVLRLLAERPLQPTDASPIASLFSRLQHDEPDIHLPADALPREIALGDARLVVHASYASYGAWRGSR